MGINKQIVVSRCVQMHSYVYNYIISVCLALQRLPA